MSSHSVSGRNLNSNSNNNSNNSGHLPSRHLWVGNLSHSILEHELTNHFLQFGELESVAFQPGRSYAFLNFKRDDDAFAAINALQGFPVAGNPLRIEFTKAVSPAPHTSCLACYILRNAFLFSVKFIVYICLCMDLCIICTVGLNYNSFCQCHNSSFLSLFSSNNNSKRNVTHLNSLTKPMKAFQDIHNIAVNNSATPPSIQLNIQSKTAKHYSYPKK